MIEVLKQAVDWAEKHGEVVFAGGGMRAIEPMNDWVQAGKQAIAELESQEPYAWVAEDVCEGQIIYGRPRKIWWECEKGVGKAIYTHPPQRTWVGLTDEERSQLVTLHHGWNEYAQAVEAKLKEKNL